MIETFPWQQFRQVFVYPVILVSGIAWGVVFLLQWRACVTRRFATLMPAMLGFSLAIWAGLSTFALWIASLKGFSQYTSAMLTVGVLAPALVLASAVVYSLMIAWKRAS